MFTLSDLRKMADDVDKYFAAQAAASFNHTSMLKVAHHKLWNHFNNFKFDRGRMFANTAKQKQRQQAAVDYCMIYAYAFQSVLVILQDKLREADPTGALKISPINIQSVFLKSSNLLAIAFSGDVTSYSNNHPNSTHILIDFLIDISPLLQSVFPTAEVNFDQILTDTLNKKFACEVNGSVAKMLTIKELYDILKN